ncbi:MAG: hypothetical protein OXU27_04315 [Candidatus Poribacteria bacterium]|nr:hypothetical protein [Candidatus Poribacteria bacterium]
MSPKPLKLTETPHWKEETLILNVKTIPPLKETFLTIRTRGPGAQQIAPHLRFADLLLLFFPTKTSLALRYSANNRLQIITSDEETKINIEKREILTS